MDGRDSRRTKLSAEEKIALRQAREVTRQTALRSRTLLRMADFHWREFDTRRSYEWKSNFALWPALGALSGFLLTKGQNLPEILAISGTISVIVIFFLYWLYWQTIMWIQNKEDRDRAYDAIAALRGPFEMPTLQKPKFESATLSRSGRRRLLSWLGRRGFKWVLPRIEVWLGWSRKVQLSITLILAAIAIIALWMPQIK